MLVIRLQMDSAKIHILSCILHKLTMYGASLCTFLKRAWQDFDILLVIFT